MDDKKNANPSQTNKQTDKSAEPGKGPATHSAAHSQVDESQKTEKSVRTRRVLSKRWVYPAIYLGAAALIIGLMYAKTQMGGGASQPTADKDNVTSTTAAATVTYTWPAEGSAGSYKIPMGFFDGKGSQQQQAAALVSYDNGFYPHKGIDIQSDSKKTFQVLASVSGVVTKVDDNQLYGKTVAVKSADGNMETYESLGSVTVKQGDHVEQGTSRSIPDTSRGFTVWQTFRA